MKAGRGRGGCLALLTFVALVAMAIGATVALGGAAPAIPATPKACSQASAARPHRNFDLKRPPQTVKRSDHLVAVVSTNCGRFEIKLDARRAPRIVNSFVYLARKHFYDGLLFYRVVANFVIQGGDPDNDGTGGPGYSVTEAPPANFKYRFGTVAMAKTGVAPPGTSESTFFIASGTQALSLPPEYADLGQVDAGLGTLKRINALGTANETPAQTVRIESIKIKGH
jgi:peptidyl-prolyl cis-trans isomerase B (cyclophilin B)